MRKTSINKILLLLLPVTFSSFSMLMTTSCTTHVSYTSLDKFDYEIIPGTTNIIINGFNNSTRLTNSIIDSINIPSTYIINDVTYTVTEIGEAAFYRGHLRNVTLPSSLISIDNFAFSDQNCPRADSDNSVDVPRAEKDTRAVNYDLSRCNDLTNIGWYAFHCNVFDHFLFPNNNYKLKDLGEDAFCGVRFFHDINLTSLKGLERLGEWDFYGTENGRNYSPDNQGHNKVIISSKTTKAGPAIFCWGDMNYIYWNVALPTLDQDPVSISSSLGYAPPHSSFFLSDIKELHVSKDANEDDWKNLLSNNSTILEGLQHYYVEKLIADIEPDGSIGTPTWIANKVGDPFDEQDIINSIDNILEWKLFGLPLEKVAELLPIIDDLLESYDDDTAPDWLKDVIDFIAEIVEPNHTVEWSIHMLQCEFFLLWDRYFKWDEGLLIL